VNAASFMREQLSAKCMVMAGRSLTSRRRFLLSTGTLAAGWGLTGADPALAQELTPTPACHDGDEPTVSQSEGPFFKPSSPERNDLREPGSGGRAIELRSKCSFETSTNAHSVRVRGHGNLARRPRLAPPSKHSRARLNAEKRRCTVKITVAFAAGKSAFATVHMAQHFMQP
jgi:hypothetical protein